MAEMPDAEREARQITQEGLPVTERVAVVVLVESRGMDAADARDRAVGAVWSKVHGGLPLLHRGHEIEGVTLPVFTVSEVGYAARSGLLKVSITSGDL